MLKSLSDWLLHRGLVFATLLINLLSAGITVIMYLIIAVAIAWWDKNT